MLCSANLTFHKSVAKDICGENNRYPFSLFLRIHFNDHLGTEELVANVRNSRSPVYKCTLPIRLLITDKNWKCRKWPEMGQSCRHTDKTETLSLNSCTVLIYFNKTNFLSIEQGCNSLCFTAYNQVRVLDLSHANVHHIYKGYKQSIK